MVEARDDDDWGDDADGEGWDDWDVNEPDISDLREPEFDHRASSFNNALEIYSTKGRTDIKFSNFDEIMPILIKRVMAVIDDLGVTSDFARALLIRNEWNPQLALRRFADDFDYCLNTFNFALGENEPPSGNQDILCEVCFCEYPLDEWIYMPDCGHGLCTYCYTGYLTSKVGDGKGVE